MKNNDLKITFDAGRGVLATGHNFSTGYGHVIWEYVKNSIDHRDMDDPRRSSISVEIQPRNKIIKIKDNGRGMDIERIKHFLTMNAAPIVEDKHYYQSRFGTGKSAFLAIADILVVDTYCNGKRNKFRISKEKLKNSEGSEAPVETLISEEDTEEQNGTLISIEGVQVKVEQEVVIKVIERRLHLYAATDPEIAVNNHICQKKELDIAEEHNKIPDEKISEVIGNVKLKIQVSRVPLEVPEIGIFVTAGEGTIVGHEQLNLHRSEMGNLITGLIDVPCLNEEVNGISAYTQARDLVLNKDHKYVSTLVTFLAQKVEEVRRELVKDKRSKQESEEGRKLQQLNNEIAEVLNESYLENQKELQRIRQASFGSVTKTLSPESEGEDEENLGVFKGGVDVRAEEEDGNREGNPKQEPISPKDKPPKSLNEDEDGSKVGGKKPSKTRPQKKGGFSVDSRDLGENHKSRYKYVKEEVKIIINTDHPSVSYAYINAGRNSQDIAFKRLMYEIAFTAYILAVAQEMTEADEMMLGDDLRYDMQRLYDDVTLKASKNLYA